ncbi:MAG TPA: cytochrome c oxidase assembly protein, partial [Gemmatimonadales bacterium]|nr:cytochrome c oxidase assembly protein [Gemmatimonadales bacterium]
FQSSRHGDSATSRQGLQRMTWWCSATGQPWTWAWKAYPGVWLFVALLAVLYVRGSRRAQPMSRGAALYYFSGLLTVWLALDWPIGPLGTGYLVSFHTVSYILLSLIAPPLLLAGIPSQAMLRASQSPGTGPVLRILARPLIALALFNAVLISTHIPDVVDGLMGSQLGAFAIDLGWFVGGIVLWWAIMAPPPVCRLTRPLKMGYLFAATLPPILPAAFLTFADYPLYAVYELAPRAMDLPAHSDQQIAGLTMKIIGDLPLWFAFGVIFFRWARESGGSNPVHPSVAQRSATGSVA